MILHFAPRCFAILSRPIHRKILNRTVCFDYLHTKSASTGQDSLIDKHSRHFGHEEVTPIEKREKGRI